MPTDPELLFDGPTDAFTTIALAHGAGAGMDTAFITLFAAGLAERGFRVDRFDFPFMAHRRKTGTRKPPDRRFVSWSSVASPWTGGSRVLSRMRQVSQG